MLGRLGDVGDPGQLPGLLVELVGSFGGQRGTPGQLPREQQAGQAQQN